MCNTVKLYEKPCKRMSVLLYRYIHHHYISIFVFQWADAREKFEKASELLVLDGVNRKTMWGQFWSAHQV